MSLALSLGTGLVVFASALSEALMEVTQYRKETPSGPDYDYQYGWCFFTAGAAFIMTKIAAVFSLSGHLNRYPSVDEMVSVLITNSFVVIMLMVKFALKSFINYTNTGELETQLPVEVIKQI